MAASPDSGRRQLALVGAGTLFAKAFFWTQL